MGTPLDASAAAAAAAPVPAVATSIATATLPAAKAAATVATGAARTCSTSSSSSSPAHVPAAALHQATTGPASSAAPGARPPAAAGAPPAGAAAEAAAGAAVASEAAPTAAAAAAEAAAALLTALPLCEKFSSSSSSSSCSGSHEPVSAAVGQHPADERPRVQPYIFGCTYTTGSSAPPVFSSATTSPSPQARPVCLSAAAAVAGASYHAAVPENLSASSSSPLPAASSAPPATTATSASLSSSCSSSASTCSAAAAAGPACAVDAVLHASAPVPTDALVAGGINFEEELNLDNMLESFLSSGFQATQLGRAIVEVRRMLRWRLSDEAVTEAEKGTEWEGMEKRRQTRCFIWLSFTSNMISSGLREVFLFLCKHRLVDVLITSAGGIEEDFVKVLAPTIIGEFSLRGDELRRRGWNRIGNLLVPNENYCLFEDWLQPILDRMLQEQHEKLRGVFARMRMQHLHACNLRKQEEQARRKYMQQKLEMKKRTAGDEVRQQQTKNDTPEQRDGTRDPEEKKRNTEEKREAISSQEKRQKEEEEMSRKATPGAEEKKTEEEEEEEVDYMGAVSDAVWTPSEVIRRLGKEINDERSVYYWCWKNEIPVFCPGLTDGSLGDNLFFHSYRKKGLVIDLVKDVRAVNDLALQCKKSGMIILGGGLPKHHTCNANLMRNGADFAVYINTGVEYDGSDSGAKPDEAVSWGKITAEAKPVKVYGDATVLFPLLVASTFAKEFHANRQKNAAENGPGHEKLGKSQEEQKKAPRRTG